MTHPQVGEDVAAAIVKVRDFLQTELETREAGGFSPYVAEAIEALAALNRVADGFHARAGGWLPIETAPRSRTEPVRILGRSGKEYVAVVHCEYSGSDKDPINLLTWQCAPGHGATYNIYATHWKPFTAPPAQPSADRSDGGEG